MIILSQKTIKDYLIEKIPKKIYNFCKLNNNEYDINFKLLFRNIHKFIQNNIYASDINDFTNNFIKFIKDYSLSIIFFGLIFNKLSFSVNTYIFFFIINTGFFFILNCKCLISYLLSIIHPPFSILLFTKYSKLNLKEIPSDTFESTIFINDMSYYCIVSAILPAIICEKILAITLIKIFCETYFGPFKKKIELNWLDNENIGNIILGSNYEKNINILQLDKLVFLRKIVNSYFLNLFIYTNYILPFILPILMIVNGLFFNVSTFSLFMFHLLIFLGTGICFFENIFITLASCCLYSNFNVIDTILTYLYIIYNFNSNTKLLELGWLDCPFYTRYQIVLKLNNSKNILINSRSVSNIKSHKFLYQHRHIRIYDPLKHIASSENGQIRDIGMLKKINKFLDYKFKNDNEAKEKLIKFHNENSILLEKNKNLTEILRNLNFTKKTTILSHFYDNINKKLLENKYDNLYYLNEIDETNIIITEIHLHIDKGCFIDNLNKFITYKSTIVKQNTKHNIKLN